MIKRQKMPNYWKIPGVPPGFAFNCIENKRFSTRYYGRQTGQGRNMHHPKRTGWDIPHPVLLPLPRFPHTCLAFVVAFSLLPVAPIAHALVLERLLKCAQAALNLVALL